MSFIHYAAKEIHCKIIYYGAGLSGKTTNIQCVYQQTQPEQRGSHSQLYTETERTLFFDFLPLALGDVNGFQVRFHLYSIPGQTFYDLSRHFILKGVDGVIFVADSQPERMEANIESFESLEKLLEAQGYSMDRLPLVLQYNKRDLPQALPIAELQATLNPGSRPFFEAVATQGKGVLETLQALSHLILDNLRGQ